MVTKLLKSLGGLRAICCFSIGVLFLVPLESLADSRERFKPFAGKWAVQTQYGASGFLVVRRNQRTARFEPEGVVQGMIMAPVLRVTLGPPRKGGRMVKISSRIRKTFRMQGQLTVDTETYQVLYGTMTFTAEQGNNSRSHTLDVGAYAVSEPNSPPREARLFIDIERVRARGAQAGKAFLLRGTVEAKGPAPVPNEKVFLFMQAPDTLSDMIVTSNNRMSRCGDLHNNIQGTRTAWCLLRSLGPGTTDKASFTVRMFPDSEHFRQGGKFNVHMTAAESPGGEITIVARPQRARATINVKGHSQPPGGDEPTDKQKQCWAACFSAGSPPGFRGSNCERCKILCGFKDTSCKPK